MASFNTAFAAARKAGKKAFEWQGKSYTTKRADDVDLPKKAPTPTPRPSSLPDKAPRPTPRPSTETPKTDTGISHPKTMVSGNRALRASTEQRNSASAVSKANSAIKHFQMTPVQKPKQSSEKPPLLGKRAKYKRASWL